MKLGRLGAAVAIAASMLIGQGASADANEIRVAVAANFTAAAKDIAAKFEEVTGDRAVLSFGSTGQLYTQISQGAPFDVFLAADQARPEKAVQEGFAAVGSVFTYATGKIVLYSLDPNLVTGEETLSDGQFEKLAIANPETAPYGAAAVQTMRALKVYDALEPKLVQGNSIAQTYQFVASGSAELGFVALSQIIDQDGGSRWPVPQSLYDPIAQDAVLLTSAADNETAKDFLSFLRGDQAGQIIDRYGYGRGN
ncbi:molybdate ABC transporter substrate-binding protein [Amorphus sp. 3PC139-8]|uniref:molybdate ABC transporter substrate-binding protein n=1 Tax=Amorphus sp. 3PC139-8 TaxID=2735676 RepID=UPI00345DBCA7